MIQIATADGRKIECDSIIVVPERALTEAGFIRAFTVKENAHAKHEYHTLAQMAYFQYQDEELEVIELHQPIQVVTDQETIDLAAGIIVFRLADGEFMVWAVGPVNKKKMLEATNRYCTRWVRLDI